MTAKIKFNGCAHLDFSDNYSAKKQILSGGSVFWLRDVSPELPSMVQFCSLRGRLNSPESCLCERSKQCSEFLSTEHVVEVEVED